MRSHRDWMLTALSLAESARQLGEVPIGAVIVDSHDKLVSTGFNYRETRAHTLMHAELLAIDSACQKLGNWRLNDCRLYVTLEPCLMCAGAIQQARVSQVIFGARDPKAGAMGSLYHVHSDPRLNHQVEILTGVLEQESQMILKDFFRTRRLENASK